jgi:hypothetical protein
LSVTQIDPTEYEVVFGYDVLDHPVFDAAEWILWKDEHPTPCVTGRAIQPNLYLTTPEDIGFPTALSFTGLGPRIRMEGYHGQIVSIEGFSQEF